MAGARCATTMSERPAGRESNGEGGRNGYFLFMFPVELEKTCYIRGIGPRRKYIEEVHVKERNGFDPNRFPLACMSKEKEGVEVTMNPLSNLLSSLH